MIAGCRHIWKWRVLHRSQFLHNWMICCRRCALIREMSDQHMRYMRMKRIMKRERQDGSTTSSSPIHSQTRSGSSVCEVPGCRLWGHNKHWHQQQR